MNLDYIQGMETANWGEIYIDDSPYWTARKIEVGKAWRQVGHSKEAPYQNDMTQMKDTGGPRESQWTGRKSMGYRTIQNKRKLLLFSDYMEGMRLRRVWLRYWDNIGENWKELLQEKMRWGLEYTKFEMLLWSPNADDQLVVNINLWPLGGGYKYRTQEHVDYKWGTRANETTPIMHVEWWVKRLCS